VAGRPVPLGEPQHQIVLGALLLEHPRVVPLHRLVDAVWGERPPATAEKQIRNRAAALRRMFTGAGCDRDLIRTERAGYRLTVGARIDAHCFDERVCAARAQREEGRYAEAAAEMRKALSLWRGRLLEGLDSQLLRDFAAAWEERRLGVLDECLALELALGRHREVVNELADLVRARPLDECTRAKLMVALYRSGRRAEALEAYQDIRRRLDASFGMSPGSSLQGLHLQMLRSDPALERATPEAMLDATAEANAKGAGSGH
jgi:DNA-binding SARP family transcriptional activator